MATYDGGRSLHPPPLMMIMITGIPTTNYLQCLMATRRRHTVLFATLGVLFASLKHLLDRINHREENTKGDYVGALMKAYLEADEALRSEAV